MTLSEMTIFILDSLKLAIKEKIEEEGVLGDQYSDTEREGNVISMIEEVIDEYKRRIGK